MTPGCIFFDKDFKFLDGSDGQKFLILLGTLEGICLVVKTTSQGRRYLLDYGCQINHRFPSFNLVKGCCCLPKQTWTCLDEYYEFTYSEVLKKYYSGSLTKFGELTKEITYSLLTCALESDDISQTQKKIVKSALLTCQPS